MMNAETSLNRVREISENATRRPAGKVLKLGAGSSEIGKPKVIVPWEELHPPRILGLGHSASGYKARGPNVRQNQPAPQKGFMAVALEKTAA